MSLLRPAEVGSELKQQQTENSTKRHRNKTSLDQVQDAVSRIETVSTATQRRELDHHEQGELSQRLETVFRQVTRTEQRAVDTSLKDSTPYHESQAVDSHGSSEMQDHVPKLGVSAVRHETQAAEVWRRIEAHEKSSVSRESRTETTVRPAVAEEPDMTSDTEDEVEITELVRAKAAAEFEAGRYDTAERAMSKVLRRYQNLAKRRSSYAADVSDTRIQMFEVYESQEKWNDALLSLDAALHDQPNASRRERIESLEEVTMRKIMLKCDFDSALEACSKLISKRRSAYGKNHFRYYEALGLKVLILMFQNESDEAEAYWSKLPLEYQQRFPEFCQVVATPPESTPTQAILAAAPADVARIDVEWKEEWLADPSSFKAQLQEFAHHGSVDQLTFLVEQFDGKTKPGPKFLMQTGDSVLHIAVRNSNLTVVKDLAQDGFEVRYINELGDMPLHVAVKENAIDAVKLLLSGESKSVVRVCAKSQRTPLHLASKGGFREIAELLLNDGAKHSDEDDKGRTALFLAAEYCRPRVLKLFLERGINIDQENWGGETALGFAIRNGWAVESIKLLLKSRANAHASQFGYTDVKWDTPLIHAIKRTRDAHVYTKVLLDHGVKLDRLHGRDYTGEYWTPLTTCIRYHPDDTTLMKYLLDHGANVNVRDRDRKTALGYTSRLPGRDTKMRELLGSYSGVR